MYAPGRTFGGFLIMRAEGLRAADLKLNRRSDRSDFEDTTLSPDWTYKVKVGSWLMDGPLLTSWKRF